MNGELIKLFQNGLPSAERVKELETAMLKHPQVKCDVVHRFGPGTYIREVNIPAGAIAVGHHQNFEHQNIFLKGRVTMFNEDGTQTELKAPMIFVAKPGRKIGYVHEDMVWLNVYATEERDVEKLEAHFLTKSDEWQKDHALRGGMKLLQASVDKKDYLQALIDIGVSEAQVRRQSDNLDDLMWLPNGNFKVKVASSKIEGQGLFATAEIKAGELVAPARVKGLRTIAGRFTNHSAASNAQMVRVGNDIDLVAIKDIAGCLGGQDGEEITIDYREAFKLTMSIARSSK